MDTERLQGVNVLKMFSFATSFRSGFLPRTVSQSAINSIVFDQRQMLNCVEMDKSGSGRDVATDTGLGRQAWYQGLDEFFHVEDADSFTVTFYSVGFGR